jgi:hypothetical protein
MSTDGAGAAQLRVVLMQRPKRAPNLEVRELPDGDVVVVNRQGTALVLNAMGGIVVYLADGTRSVDEIAREIQAATSHGDIAIVLSDVRALISRLADSECIVDAE